MDKCPDDPHSYSLRVDVVASLYPNNYIDCAVAHWLGRRRQVNRDRASQAGFFLEMKDGVD